MSSANKPGFAIINADVGNEESVQSVTNRVIYKPITLDELREKVPIATWYPSTLNGISSSDDRLTSRVIYEHGISVSKIGNKLAGWKVILLFVMRNFRLTPTYTNIVQLQSMKDSTPNFASSTLPVVLLAHGYLGSRFDLSHYAEDLGSEGFLVISPEYPESLADSYNLTTKPID